MLRRGFNSLLRLHFMCKKILAIIIACVFLIGCEKSKPIKNPDKPTSGIVVSNVLQAKVGDYIYDVAGCKYKKRTDAVKTEAWEKTAVWERVEPLVTNRWYVPTLSSTMFTNDPPSFTTLFRMEGEDEPFFTD